MALVYRRDTGVNVTHSDWGPAAGEGQTVVADNRNSERLRLNASRYYDDDDDRLTIARPSPELI